MDAVACLSPSDVRWLLEDSNGAHGLGARDLVSACRWLEDERGDYEYEGEEAAGKRLGLALANGRRLLCATLRRRLETPDAATTSASAMMELELTHEQYAPSEVTALLWLQLDFGPGLKGADSGWYLVVGFEDGTLRFLDEGGKRVAKEFSAHGSAVRSIRANSAESGLRRDTRGVTSQGLCVCSEDAVVVLSLEDLLRVHHEVRNRGDGGRGKGRGRRRGSGGRRSDDDLARFDLSPAVAGAADAVCLGCENLSLAQQLEGVPLSAAMLRVIVAGDDPALCCVRVRARPASQDGHGGGLLSAALDWGTSAIPIVGRIKRKIAGRAAGAGASERDQVGQASAPISTGLPFLDPGRQCHTLVPCPTKPLVCCCDSLGRILVLDASNFVITRVLKGYRDAEASWAVRRGRPLLAVLAPRRERVEVWDVLEGRRTSKAACGRNDALARAHWSLAGNAMARDGGGGAGEPVLVSVSHTGGIEIRRIFATEADEPA